MSATPSWLHGGGHPTPRHTKAYFVVAAVARSAGLAEPQRILA
jgi:hypothetical protein